MEGSSAQLRGRLCSIPRALFVGQHHENVGESRLSPIWTCECASERTEKWPVRSSQRRASTVSAGNSCCFLLGKHLYQRLRVIHRLPWKLPSPKALHIYIWLVTHIWQKKKGKHGRRFTERQLRGTTSNTAAHSRLEHRRRAED